MAPKHKKKQPCAQVSEFHCRQAMVAKPSPCVVPHISGQMTLAAAELSAIVSETESASDTIMTCAEAILESDQETREGFAELVIDQVTRILEACAFQDITGQRAARLRERLQQVEAHLALASGGVGEVEDALAPSPEEARREARRKRLMLHGPQSASEAISQDDVDTLFSGGEATRNSRAARRAR